MAGSISEQLHQQILWARENERKQIARELHDEIIQSLITMNYHLSEMRKQRGGDNTLSVTRLQDDLHQVINNVRQICVALRPPVLDSLGLAAAIRSHVRELERRGLCRIVLQVPEELEQPIPEPIAICLYRILQEALVNVQKHAEATQIVVRLDLYDSRIRLVVQDNGKGFSIPPQLDQLLYARHFGLVGIREQLDMINGTLEIASAPGRGTCLEATVLLPRAVPGNQEELRELYA
jgi:signal transduction histidine kinase